MFTLKLDAKVNIKISDGKSKININFFEKPLYGFQKYCM